MSARKIYRIPNIQEFKLLLDYCYVIVFENKRERMKDILPWERSENGGLGPPPPPPPHPHVLRDKRILPLPSPSSALFF